MEPGIKGAAAKTLHLGKLSALNKLPRPRIEGARESRVEVEAKTVKGKLAPKGVIGKISVVENIYTCVCKSKFPRTEKPVVAKTKIVVKTPETGKARKWGAAMKPAEPRKPAAPAKSAIKSPP